MSKIMWRAAWGMARNDVAIWLRSPAAIAAAVLPAIGMALLVGVLTNSVGQQPVGLVVEGEGRLAKRMARILKADKDAYLLSEMNSREAEKAFGEQRIAAMIQIPSDFDERVVAGDASLGLYLNNVNIDLADDLRRSVTRSAVEFDAPQLGLLGELHGPSDGVLLPNPYRVAVAERDLRETEVSFLEYQMIPAVILIVINVGLLGTSLLTARDFERSRAKALILSPASRLSLVLGRLLGGSLITLLFTTPLAVACVWIFSAHAWTHVVALAGLLVAVIVMTVALGTLLGVTLRRERVAVMVGLNAAVYLFFLGGGFTTIAFLPGWLQTASRLVPISYAVEGLRQTLFYPELTGVGRDIWVLFAFAVASVVLASLRLAKGWQR